MCVIAYIPKESKEPSKSDLLMMWRKNPHGGGIMWIEDDGRVFFSKGYMDFDDFYKDFLIIKRDYNFECAVHFRIATSGGINQQMCHPFSMTNDETKIQKLYGKTDVCIMHNGVIPIDNRPYLNDTCEYIIRNLYPVYERDSRFFLHLTKHQEIMMQNDIGYSKLLFFCADGVKMIGNWIKKNDLYFSNLNWSYDYGYKTRN